MSGAGAENLVTPLIWSPAVGANDVELEVRLRAQQAGALPVPVTLRLAYMAVPASCAGWRSHPRRWQSSPISTTAASSPAGSLIGAAGGYHDYADAGRPLGRFTGS